MIELKIMYKTPHLCLYSSPNYSKIKTIWKETMLSYITDLTVRDEKFTIDLLNEVLSVTEAKLSKVMCFLKHSFFL